ncbi:MAG: eL32 family ribosomal protein [Candidatus Micrarchaeaceae archaeon]
MKKNVPWFKVPNFGAKNRKRVKDRWRAQRGIDNKTREKRKGYLKMPNIGYKNPEELRFTRNGKKIVLVRNKEEMLNTDKETLVYLSHALSKRKKIELQRIADEKGIEVANRVKA